MFKPFSIWSTSSIEYCVRNQKCDCNKSKRKFYNILFGLIVFLLPLTAIIIVKIEDFQKTVSVLIAEIFLIITYLVVSVLLCEILHESYVDKHSTVGHHQHQVQFDTCSSSSSNVPSIIEEKLNVKTEKADIIINVFITILAIGNSTFQLTIVANEILRVLNLSENTAFFTSLSVLKIFTNSIKCVYDLCLLVFIIHNEKLKNILKCLKWKPFIGFLSLSIFFQWIYVILQETNYEKKYFRHDIKNESLNISHPAKFIVLDRIQEFLYPFGIEFQIICFIEILSVFLWQTNFSRLRGKIFKKVVLNSSRVKNAMHYVFRGCAPLCNKDYMSCNLRVHHEITPSKPNAVEHTCKLFAFICSNIIISLLIVLLFFQESNFENKTLVRAINTISNLILVATTSFYSIFLCLITSKRSSSRKEHETIYRLNEQRIDFAALFISNLSLISFKVITIIADVHVNIPAHIKICEIVLLSLSCVQSTLQLFHMNIFTYKLKLESGYIQLLIAFNFALWLMETFSITNDQTHDMRRKVYGHVGAELWNVAVLPLAIFYRMHSCIVLVKINSDLYYNMH